MTPPEEFFIEVITSISWWLGTCVLVILLSYIQARSKMKFWPYTLVCMAAGGIWLEIWEGFFQ
jgi:hypothetical protein